MFTHPDLYSIVAKQREAELIKEAAWYRIVSCLSSNKRHRDRWPDDDAAPATAENNVVPVATLGSCDLEPELALVGQAR
jgi:hypothetical protein